MSSGSLVRYSADSSSSTSTWPSCRTILPADSAVVVLVLDALTPAGVERLPGDDDLVVVILVVFSVDDAAAGCLLAYEVAVRVHDPPRYELPGSPRRRNDCATPGIHSAVQTAQQALIGVRKDPKPPRGLRRGTVYAERPARCKRDFRRGLCAWPWAGANRSRARTVLAVETGDGRMPSEFWPAVDALVERHRVIVERPA